MGNAMANKIYEQVDNVNNKNPMGMNSSAQEG